MVVPFRSALLVCAAMSAGSVAPAQVGVASQPIQEAASVNPSAIAQDLLQQSDQLAVPLEPEVVETAEPEEPEVPAIDKGAALPALVAQMRGTEPGSRELECLAAGVYFESKGEPLLGQLAVGEVIVNRAKSGRFPDTYCGVLLQRGQFSFVRGKSWPRIAKASRAWRTAVAIAKIVDQDLKDSLAGNALFFHAKRVRPGWKKKRIASIGNHIFYR